MKYVECIMCTDLIVYNIVIYLFFAGTIKSLKQELMMHDALAERSGVSYDEYTPEERYDVEKSVRKYLDMDETTTDDAIGGAFGSLQSMRHVGEIFKAFKTIVRSVETKTEERLRQQFTLGPKSPGGTAAAGGGAAGGGDGSGAIGGGGEEDPATGDAEGGDIEGGAGYAVGVAASDARPQSIDMGDAGSPLRGGPSSVWGEGGGDPDSESRMPGSPGSPGSSRGGASMQRRGGGGPKMSGTSVPESRPEAFVLYKQADGYEYSESLRNEKRKMKVLQKSSRTVRETLNAHKLEIDRLKSEIEMKRSMQSELEMETTNEGDMIIDEEEFRLMNQLKDAKRGYRERFAEHKEISMKLNSSDKAVRVARQSLVTNFDRWFAVATGEALLDGAKDLTNDDRLDEGEMFEKMEMERVMDEDPESVAFFMAQKNLGKAKRKDHGSTNRAIRDKRLNK